MPASDQARAKSTTPSSPLGLEHRRRAFAAKRAVLWGIVSIVSAHLVLIFLLASIVPEIRDPDQTIKLRALRDGLAGSSPGRPLFLLMGSSRVAMGYRPELVERDDGPLHFNYGLCFSGALLDLITLHRLLDEGIRPNAVMLEVWPPRLAMESAERPDASSVDVNRLSRRDLAVLSRHSHHPKELYKGWLVNRLESWFTYRFTLTKLYGPAMFDASQEPEARWSGMHERGWLGQSAYLVHPAPETYQRYLTHTRFSLAGVFERPFMTEASRSALTEFLEVCRRERIRVGLLWMPESPEFRRSYDPKGLAQAKADLQAVAENGGAPILDAHDWIPEDGFVDGYHLTHGGAELFTRLLDRRALAQFDGRPVDDGESVAKFLSELQPKQARPEKRSEDQSDQPISLSIRSSQAR